MNRLPLDPWSITAFSSEDVDEYLANTIVVPTGLAKLDSVFPEGGITLCSSIQLCGMRGSGKSTFALNICDSVTRNKHAMSYFINWEMGRAIQRYLPKPNGEKRVLNWEKQPSRTNDDSIINDYEKHLKIAAGYGLPLLAVLDSQSKIESFHMQARVLQRMIDLNNQYEGVLIILNHLDGSKEKGSKKVGDQSTEVYHLLKRPVHNATGAKIYQDLNEDDNREYVINLKVVKSRTPGVDGALIKDIPLSFD